ncbi:MAG: hypothetical protein ACRYF4_08580 [Janthinobacterium lividum]
MSQRLRGAWLTAIFGMVCCQPDPAQIPRGLGEIPQAGISSATGFDVQHGGTVSLVVTNRRKDDVEKPQVLEDQRRKVLGFLRGTQLTIVDTAIPSDYILELVDEPHTRWGMYHYQIDFYAFLLLRKRSSGELLYCAYQRAEFFRSATSDLLRRFVTDTQTHIGQSGNLRECANLAMRPS